MKTEKIKISQVLLGALLYVFLFWQQELGLNLLIFNILVIIIVYLTKGKKQLSLQTHISAIGVIWTALMVVINHSLFSIVIYFFNIAIFVGFSYSYDVRTIYTAILASFPKTLTAQFDASKNFLLGFKNSKFKPIFNFLKITILPIIVLFIFHLIFKVANPIYKKYSEKYIDSVINFLSKLFENINFNIVFFYILGASIMIIFVYNGYIDYFKSPDKKQNDNIIRKRKKLHIKKLTAGLRLENKIGVAMIFMINALLLIINIIDINWIWFGKINTNSINLTQLVHQGTYMLILSIFLSMGIILYFFRRNQNFYAKNKVLKIGAFVWIFQNVILSISVALRNYHYIKNFGLAYKRIGVIIFLLLTIIGLILMFIKVKDKKSAFYLWRTNTWSLYFMMLFVVTFNWDVAIAKYNINPKFRTIDRFFLYKLSDKALYVIIEKNDIILQNGVGYITSGLNSNDDWNASIIKRKEKFVKRYRIESWQSWNYADYKSYKRLTSD